MAGLVANGLLVLLLLGGLALLIRRSAQVANRAMGFGRSQPGPAALVSTIKLMQAGFTEVMDTEAMFRKCFSAMQNKGLLPRP